jgi:hypothetical protein
VDFHDTSLAVAKAYDSGYGIVLIDLSKVPSMKVEVWRHAPRVTGVRGLPYHRSIWAQEVTVFQIIPHYAIVGRVGGLGAERAAGVR